ARIKVPVMLAHGGRDRRVPIVHAQQFRSAAENAGVKVEWVLYGDEYHGFYLPAAEADYWERMDKFLKRAMSDTTP
ncbi:MAG: S9 family peptidase, partial [Betaproteobacteria bacterium]